MRPSYQEYIDVHEAEGHTVVTAMNGLPLGHIELGDEPGTCIGYLIGVEGYCVVAADEEEAIWQLKGRANRLLFTPVHAQDGERDVLFLDEGQKRPGRGQWRANMRLLNGEVISAWGTACGAGCHCDAAYIPQGKLLDPTVDPWVIVEGAPV